MKMKYSETYDWSARKFWTNFLVWIIGLLIIQIIGWYLKENFADWKYYLGWGMIVISAVLIISNLLTASNRSSWIKNKNKLDYLAKFDQRNTENLKSKEKIEEIFNNGLNKSLEEKLKNRQ